MPSEASVIVHICPCYVDLEKEMGGVANIVRQLTLGPARRGREVVVICGNRELGTVVSEPKVEDVDTDAGSIRVHVLRQRAHPLLGPTRALRNTLAELDRPFVGHVHTCFSAFTESAMRHMAKSGIPFAFTPHGKLSPEFLQQHYWPKRVWWRLLARDRVLRASAVALSSAAESRAFGALGLPDRFSVIPNGYVKPADPPEEVDVQPPPAPYILFLGAIDPRKQPEFLVRAFAASKSSESHKLVFVGPDSYDHKKHVLHTIARCGCEEQVIFWGPAYGREKWRLLDEATCFALPSRAEGLPVVLCEALGAGLPILISDSCNFHEAAVEGAALEMDDFDAARWADAIDSVCLNPKRHEEMASAARKMAPRHTWDFIVERWLALYDELARSTAENTSQA